MESALDCRVVNVRLSDWETAKKHQVLDIPHGAEQTRQLLLQIGFVLSMSRAGAPTDNGYAERFVGIFKLAVAERRPYHCLGAFLRAAQDWINFYNQVRPHEGLGNLSPKPFAERFALEKIPSITLL